MIRERIEELREEVLKHDRLYDEGKPEITDAEYDVLYLELVKLEKEHPEYDDPASPTKRIVVSESTKVSRLSKVTHSSPMLSQEKATTFDEVKDFMVQMDDEILIQEKLDGLTVVLRYSEGQLKQAITRGNGLIGEDVTHIVKAIDNVPKNIAHTLPLEVRGEVIMPYESFEKANVDGKYSNPRNFASGQLRRLDSDGISDLGLKVIVFDITDKAPYDEKTKEGLLFNYDMEQLGFLDSQGFETVRTMAYEKDAYELVNVDIDEYESGIRKTLPYMIDGLVVKLNDLSKREKFGSTSKHPKWSLAYKFRSLDASTTLLDVMWSVGKQGQITPVAILDTVNIDFVNISKATLHNVRNIRDKDIRINDRVIVKRANDVIPFIVGPVVEVRNGFEEVVTPPDKCPSCGESTSYEGEHLYCTNRDCEPQLKGRLVHYGTRDAMDIDGLAEKTIEMFYDNGIVKNLVDIYRIKDKEDEIVALEGFGKKKFDKIVQGVEDSKKKDFNHFLYGLCIRNIGRTTSKTLAKEFGNMDNILSQMENPASMRDRLVSIPDFGETMANSFVDFFMDKENIKMIEVLKGYGINMEEINKEKPPVSYGSDVAGKSFAITGKLETVDNRATLEGMIEAHGGKVAKGVSKNTDYLVNNDSTSNSSKNKKAKDLGIPIITEAELLDMMD